MEDSLFEDLQKSLKSLNLENSLDKISEFIQTNPDNIDSLALAGRVCTKLNRFDEALIFFQKVLKIDPNNKSIASDLKTLQKRIIKDYESRSCEPKINPLTYFSMDPYPGDDEIVILEKEILLKKYLKSPLLKKTSSLSNPKEAARHAILSQENKIAGNTDEAIREITTSIELDSNNPSWRVLRAQLHFTRDDLPQAINDLIAIPKAFRDRDIWKMGGLVLQQLGLPVLAELWFKCAAKSSVPIDQEAAVLFQQVRVDRVYSPLIAEDSPITIKFTSCGRSVIASQNIKEGSLIFTDCPIINCPTLCSWNCSTCGYCGQSIMTAGDYFSKVWNSLSGSQLYLIEKHWPVKSIVSCKECSHEIYCGKACRDTAWVSYHSVICPGKNPAAKELYELCENNGRMYDDSTKQFTETWSAIFSPMVLAKIWAHIISAAENFMKLDGAEQPSLLHWAKAKSPYRRFIALGAEELKPNMPKVVQLMDNIFSSCYNAVRYPITEEEFHGRFYQATCNLQAYGASISPYKTFINRLVDEPDAISLLQHLTRKPKEAILTGLFPLHSCLNHSCLNNVEVSDSLNDGVSGVQVRARREIKAGEELLTTYIDTRTPRKLRRAWLFRSYNFMCTCKRCKFEGDDSETCTNCGIEASNGKQFPACGKCRKAWYCGPQCQKMNWSAGHKVVCNTPHSNTCYTEDD